MNSEILEKRFLKNQMKLKGKWDAWEKAIDHMCDWINESKLGQKSCNWEFSQRRCFLICSLTLLISTLFLCSKFQTKSSHKQFLFLIIFTTWSNYELNIQNAMMEIFILFFFYALECTCLHRVMSHNRIIKITISNK